MNDINVLNFNEAFNALNEVSNSFTVDAYIPSKNTNWTFKEINAKQQKELLGAAMDTSVYNLGFSTVFYNILKENLISDGDINELNLSDKASIALSLKSQITSDLKVKFDDKNDITSNVDVNVLIEKFKTYTTPTEVKCSLKNDKTELDAIVRYPTLKVELDYDTEFKQNKKTEDVKTNQDFQKIITTAFIGETSKYIKTVTINGAEIDLDGMTFKQRINLIEKIPSGLLQQVLETVSKWKKELDEVLSVQEGEYTKVITIDSLLFLS